MALASREVTGLNKVMPPVPAGTPTAGHAVLTAVMPPAVMSPDRAQPAASRIRAIGASWLSFTGTRTFSTDEGRPFAWGRTGGTLDRKSVVQGKMVSVRVGVGGRRIIKTKK